MNVFIAQGEVKALEFKGGSFVFLIETGKDNIDPEKPIQAVRKFNVRLPKDKFPADTIIDVGDIVEIFGHISGIAKKNAINNNEHIFPEIVASNVQLCEILDPEQSSKKLRFTNRFNTTGIIKLIRDFDNPKKPTVAYVQVSAKRPPPTEDKNFRRTDTIPVNFFGAAKERLLKKQAENMAENFAFNLTGYVQGILTQSPAGDGISLQQELHPQVVISHIEDVSCVTKAMISPIAFVKGHDINTDSDNSKPKVMETTY